MKKLNETIQNKLILQAEEAKTVGLTKLGEAVYEAVVSKQVVADTGAFNHEELQDVVHMALWRAACEVAGYYDLQSADIQKMDEVIVQATDKFVREVEACLGVEGELGPNEEVVPGQKSK